MTARELISNLRRMGPQSLNVIFAYVAEHLYGLDLADGRMVGGGDISSAKEALLELAEASRIPESLVNSLSNTTIGQGKVNFKMPEQPRWDRTCPKCFHVHEKDDCCGVDLGKGGFCDCKAEVVA